MPSIGTQLERPPLGASFLLAVSWRCHLAVTSPDGVIGNLAFSFRVTPVKPLAFYQISALAQLAARDKLDDCSAVGAF